jgi:palmitoyl transferase
MAFEDSNHHPQTVAGYAHIYNWDLDDPGDWKVGIGYALTLTQRIEYKFIPLPLPLPAVSINYKKFSLQANYVPGIQNDGNVLFAWVKWTF